MTDGITQLDEQQRKVLPRIEALLKKYDMGKDHDDQGILNEAAAALAKAQELLTAYNLSADLVGQGGEDGVREEQKLEGGARMYERDLWRAVAELNFCLYFPSRTRRVTAYKRTRADGSKYIDREEKIVHLHRLVGRKVNVMATVQMAKYLEDAIERLVDERIGGNGRERWTKFNVTFREGAADTVCNKLALRRRELVDEEERKAREAAEAARQAGVASGTTSTALTITSHAQAEKDANNDHANGWEPGRTASLRAKWQAEAAERAERDRLAREAHVRWCEENPEEARRMEEERERERRKAEARERRNARRRENYEPKGYRGWTQADERRYEESQAFRMGAKAAEKISIDQQMGGGKRGQIG